MEYGNTKLTFYSFSSIWECTLCRLDRLALLILPVDYSRYFRVLLMGSDIPGEFQLLIKVGSLLECHHGISY